MPITTTLEFAPTRAGIAEARSELERLAAELWGEAGDTEDRATPESARVAPSESPAVIVYRNASDGGQSQKLLELLPGDPSNAVTPTEIGTLLPDEEGNPRSPAYVRAVMRNIKRNEHTRRVRGEMPADREILTADWSRYEIEGCGRYYLSAADRRAIDEYVEARR